MSSSYTYSVTGDCTSAGGNVSPGSVMESVRASAGITTAVQTVRLAGDALTVTFASALSVDEKAALDAAVAAYVTPTALTTQGLYVQNNDESSTTSQDFETKVELAVANLKAGAYSILWSFEIGNATSAKATEAQVIVDDADVLTSIKRKYYTSDDFYNVAGHRVYTFATAGSHTIKIQYRSVQKFTAKIRNSEIRLVPRY